MHHMLVFQAEAVKYFFIGKIFYLFIKQVLLSKVVYKWRILKAIHRKEATAKKLQESEWGYEEKNK